MTRGIFANSAQSKKMAKPLTFRGVGALGRALGKTGLGDVVPWQCWDKAGFKDCHAASWTKAAGYCKALIADDKTMYNGDINYCIGQVTDAEDWDKCVPKFCPPVQTSSGISWRNTTPNASVKKLQADLNLHLKAHGFDQIGVDGILGSGTCGAAYYIDSWDGTTFFRDYGLAKVCQTTKVPTKGGKPVTTVAVAPQVTITGQSVEIADASLPWGVASDDTAAVQRQLNVQLDSANMNQLNVTGVLDAPTCGAMKWQKDTQGFDMLTVTGKNCQAFQAPTLRAKPTAAEPKPADVSTLPATTSPSAKTAQASMATTGLLVGLGAAGLYLVGKHYSWF